MKNGIINTNVLSHGRALVIAVLVSAVCLSPLAQAKKKASGKTEKKESVSLASAGHHQQEVGAFAGLTMVSSKSYFTLGGDYEYRLSQMNGNLGIVGVIELIFADSTPKLFGVGAAYHFLEHARAVAAIGSVSGGDHTGTLIRVGGSYELDVKGYNVAPTLYIDSVDSTTSTVIGATVNFPL